MSFNRGVPDRALLLIGLSDPLAAIFEEYAAEHAIGVIRGSASLGLTLRREKIVLCLLGPDVAETNIRELAVGVLKHSPEVPVVVLSRGLPASLIFQLAKV